MDIDERIEKLNREMIDITKNVSSLNDVILPVLDQITKEIIKIQDKQSEIVKNQQLLMCGDILHISTADYGNIGDRILSDMVKKTIQYGFERRIEWSDRGVGDIFDIREARYANDNKAIVVGGGGLFFSSEGQKNSWQWNVTGEAIDGLKIPLFIFGVGYNQFRGQGDIAGNFRQDINKLARRSEFIGLRNHGSIEAIKKYLEPENRSKIVWQPCPTTIISKICPEMNKPGNDSEDKFIAVNMAFDKNELRFSKDGVSVFNERMCDVINVLRVLQERYKIKYYSHFDADKPFLSFMDQAGIRYELVDLFREDDNDKIYEAYSTPELVIGMRGHAQMIPFGLGTPILSIVSHNKMQWFLEDIGHSEWGVDVREEDFAQKLYERALNILNNKESVKQEISHIQDRLFKVTMENVAKIHKVIE